MANSKVSPRPAIDRLMDKVEKLPSGCWRFTGYVDKMGYGKVNAGGCVAVHRIAYIAAHGPIPEGLVVDHVCHDPGTCHGGPNCPHRSCVNPDHLSVTTRTINGSRERRCPTTKEAQRSATKAATAKKLARTHCPYGHTYTPESTHITPRGYRSCRICRAEYMRAYKKLRRNLSVV